MKVHFEDWPLKQVMVRSESTSSRSSMDELIDLHMYPPEFDGAMLALEDEVPNEEEAWEVAGHRIAPPLGTHR